jgi:hypothetical protein
MRSVGYLLAFGCIILISILSMSASSASKMTYGPSADIQVTLNCCGTFVTNEIYSSNNGPSGHFWNMVVWIGRQGGESSQPLDYFFTLQDYISGVYNGINQCGNSVNYWSGNGPTTDPCAMSGYFGGLMNVAYSLTNLDTQYSRTYNILTHSNYE